MGASGGCAGTLSLLFVYSLDFARTRMANDAKGKDGKRQFNGLIDVYRKTIASDDPSFLFRFMLGYSVTVSAGLASYPIDTIRRRMMMTSGTGVNYKSSMDCGMQI